VVCEEDPLKLIVDELALNVKPVVVPILNAVPLADSVHRPLPRFIVLVPVPLPLNPVLPLSVTLLLLALKSSVPVNAPQVID
jgi:hypothetical protein